jgi:hypothetical protein
VIERDLKELLAQKKRRGLASNLSAAQGEHRRYTLFDL